MNVFRCYRRGGNARNCAIRDNSEPIDRTAVRSRQSCNPVIRLILDRSLSAGLGSGRSATSAIHIALRTEVFRDLANVSIFDHLRPVIWLFGFVFLAPWLWFTFHALSPSSSSLGARGLCCRDCCYLCLRRSSNCGLGVRKPVVQREDSEIGPEAVGCLFIRQ